MEWWFLAVHINLVKKFEQDLKHSPVFQWISQARWNKETRLIFFAAVTTRSLLNGLTFISRPSRTQTCNRRATNRNYATTILFLFLPVAADVLLFAVSCLVFSLLDGWRSFPVNWCVTRRGCTESISSRRCAGGSRTKADWIWVT